jgi:hypothetical protein
MESTSLFLRCFAAHGEMNLIVFCDDMRVTKNTLHEANVRPKGVR